MQVMNDDIQFDRFGRMVFHPDFHQNHRKPYTESDLEYLCKYYESDHRRTIAFAMGRPEHSLATLVSKLKSKGKFDYYKNLNKHW